MNCRLCTRSARSGWSRNPDLSSGSPWPRDSVRRVTTWRPRERRGYRRTPTRDSWSLVSSRSWLPTLTPCPPAPPCLMQGQSLTPVTGLRLNIAFVFRNINSLGILRHFARVGSSENNVEVPREAHENSRNGEHQVLPSSHPIDYRFQPTEQSEV